jgi:hypothetical protein
MSRKKLLIGVVALLVVSLALVGVACCGGGEATPTPAPTATPTPVANETATPAATETATPTAGEAPTLASGDTWTYSVAYESDTNTMTQTVSAVGADSYTVDVTYDANIKRSAFGLDVEVSGIEGTISKDNLDMTKQVIQIAKPISTTATYTYVYTHPAAKWPLAVGNEWSFELTTKTALGTDTFDRTVKVVAEEDVTVGAETFSCFKIETSEGGAVVKTEWFAEDVKNFVKVVDAATYASEETWELTSYTVAP